MYLIYAIYSVCIYNFDIYVKLTYLMLIFIVHFPHLNVQKIYILINISLHLYFNFISLLPFFVPPNNACS